MCVKLPLENLSPDLYPPHPISTYTYKMTITPMVTIFRGYNLISDNYCKVEFN